MSLTSLIDVIFLLLLFFMLTSTFSRFAEVELTAGTPAGATQDGRPPLFLRLAPEALSLNGTETTLAALPDLLAPEAAAPDAPDASDATLRPLLVSLAPEVTAQRLTDLLAVLRRQPGLAPTVLGGGL